MRDKEYYLELMRRYFEAECSPAEERALARYAARSEDPAFDPLRGVLGYLSLGRKQVRRTPSRSRLLAVAVASVTIFAAIGVGVALRTAGKPEQACIRYAYGERIEDETLVMTSVEATLADFFGQASPAEVHLKELFQP